MKHESSIIHNSLSEDTWQELRKKRFTASQIYKLMGTPRNKSEVLSETAKTFIYEKSAEILTNQRAEIYGRALDWGNEHERQAYDAFDPFSTLATYYGGETYIFIEYGEFGGYSPDALGADFIVELKCPFNSGIHLRNFSIENASDLKSLHPEYYWQMQMGMIATACEVGYFVSFDPRMPDSHKRHIATIELDDVKDLIDERLHYAGQMLSNVIKLS
jgi:hypothetical protein